MFSSVRLSGGRSISEGRVEISRDNITWSNVCDDGWGIAHARQMCQVLGFTGKCDCHVLVFTDLFSHSMGHGISTQCGDFSSSVLTVCHHDSIAVY